MDKILLNDRQGAQWVFRCNGKDQLCYCRDGAHEQILQSDVKAGFDLVTDEEGNFHMVVQALDGSLIYLTYDFDNWKKYIILQSKSSRSTMSRFKSFVLNEKIHCFYILDFSGKSMLVHHIFSPTEPAATPNVISYTDSAKNFSCVLDSDNRIHIFFFNESSRLQYKIYHSGVYADSTVPVEDDIKDISVICDQIGVHLLYTAKMKSYYTLIYYSLTAKERKIISFGDSNISTGYIYIHGKNIYVQWRERMRCYQCVSADGGITFKKPVHIAESRNKRTTDIRIRSRANPACANADRCIALSDGSTIDILNAADCIGSHVKANLKGRNHKPEKNDYNIIDGAYSDEIKMIQSKIRENEREIIRLNTIINTLSDKISAMAKISAEPSPPLPEEAAALNSEAVGEINIENYELFKNTDIENIDFENSITFNKE